MKIDEWQRMKEVLVGALAVPVSERAAFLSRACDGEEMRQRAESLLADADSADAFLESSALAEAAEILEDSAKHTPALTPGQRLGPYEILSALGAGGMGEVYRARHSQLDRDVAIKVLPASVAADPPTLARFEREAKAVAALSHPNILAIHDFGTQDGIAYAVMELLDGETLRDKLDAGPIPRMRAVEWALQVARGLSAAHEKGIVHRDLKPENVFVTRDGHLKILDFGLAKRDEAVVPGEQTKASTAAGHTEPGTLMGTVGYMSPEQVRGLPVDHRSDIFSFGAVLYEMLAGHRAFSRPTPADMMSAIMKEEPPELSQSGRNIPIALDHIVKHCLEKDRENRFQSARDIAFDLSEQSSPAVTNRAQLAASSKGKSSILIAVAASVILAVGGLFLLRRPHSGAGGAGSKRVAVLPFENLGSAEDDYFADGIADAVRGKLTSLPGLQVIARSSSMPYKKTTKTPRQIAEELNAFYLLTATVRWQKTGGSSRVQLNPELVDVTRPDAPTARWQQPFDAALTDVFQVQSDIASRVAQALGVALGASEEKRLSEKPTQDLAAYDAFLKGEADSASMSAVDPPSIRKALGAYEQAVALDPRFALAWAQLSRACASLYFFGTPIPSLAARARSAAEKAVALAPDRPEGYHALGTYHFFVIRDPSRALEEYSRGQRLARGNADLFAAMAYVEQVLGRWEEAVELCREAERIDPRSVLTLWRLGQSLSILRRYPEAREAFDRGLAFAPADLALVQGKAMLFLNEGDLAGARAVLGAAPVERTALVAHIATYWDLVWVLDEGLRDLLLRLTPSAFDEDRGAWGLCLVQASALKGDAASVRHYAEEARKAFEEQLRAVPEDPQRHVLLGLALAYLGRKEEAIGEGERGLALQPVAKDAMNGPYFQHQLARIYMMVGEPEKALDQLEPLLKVPCYLSSGWLKIDPNFDPLRKNPRFQRLVAGANRFEASVAHPRPTIRELSARESEDANGLTRSLRYSRAASIHRRKEKLRNGS
jgi:serine/threonine protein kinase/tetratricopeptide (TPR) repeat protein